MRFKIVVTGWNCPQYVRRCLDSVTAQTDTGYDVCMVDDASDHTSGGRSPEAPGEQAEIVAAVCARRGWRFAANQVRRGALFNQFRAIHLLRPDRPDVIFF